MVRIVSALCVATLAGSASAFSAAPFGVSSSYRTTALFMSEEESPAESAVEAPVKAPRPSSGKTITEVRKAVSKLTKDNFSQTLSDIEPFLLNDAGATIYAKSMKRIAVQAKALGVEVPEGYALDAKATEKRREKQNAFIQTKEEERLAAEAEAAEAAAAEEEQTDAAAETEPVAEEEAVEEKKLVEA